MLHETIMISVPGLSVSSLLLQDGDFIRRVTIVSEESNTFRNKREAKKLYFKEGNDSVAVNIEQKFLCKTFDYMEIDKNEVYLYLLILRLKVTNIKTKFILFN